MLIRSSCGFRRRSSMSGSRKARNSFSVCSLLSARSSSGWPVPTKSTIVFDQRMNSSRASSGAPSSFAITMAGSG